MKKFLSILLALAVGFTFTFGSAMSAFAATPSGTPADEYTNNQNTLTKEYNDCIATLAAKYTETVTSGSTTVKLTRLTMMQTLTVLLRIKTLLLSQ